MRMNFFCSVCNRREWENETGAEVIDGSRGTISALHSKMGRKEENQGSCYVPLAVKTLQGGGQL